MIQDRFSVDPDDGVKVFFPPPPANTMVIAIEIWEFSVMSSLGSSSSLSVHFSRFQSDRLQRWRNFNSKPICKRPDVGHGFDEHVRFSKLILLVGKWRQKKSAFCPGTKIQPNLKPSIHSRLLQSFGGVGHPHEEGGWMSGLFSEAGSKGGRTVWALTTSFRLNFGKDFNALGAVDKTEARGRSEE